MDAEFSFLTLVLTPLIQFEGIQQFHPTGRSLHVHT